MTLFGFEQNFADSLRCIPMSVRLKLDLCGLKLGLHQWAQFSLEQRRACLHWPLGSPQDLQGFSRYVQQVVASVCQEPVKTIPVDPHPEWQNPDRIPAAVQQKAEALGIQIPLAFWRNLQDIQRFALVKLSRSNHENRNFWPALREFGWTSPS